MNSEDIIEIFDAPVSIQSFRTLTAISISKFINGFFQDKMGNSNSTLASEIDMENRTVRGKLRF